MAIEAKHAADAAIVAQWRRRAGDRLLIGREPLARPFKTSSMAEAIQEITLWTGGCLQVVIIHPVDLAR